MPQTTLLIYSTTDGQTRRICERLRHVVERAGQQVTLTSIEEAAAIDMQRFDKVVVGASIRYGKHSERVYRYIDDHRATLESKPNAFFSVNVVARKPQKNTPATNPYVQKFLHRSRWRPTMLGVFAGRIDYALYGLRDRWIIRFIMWLTNGPTDPHAAVEFTDWQQVEAFGHSIAALK